MKQNTPPRHPQPHRYYRRKDDIVIVLSQVLCFSFSARNIYSMDCIKTPTPKCRLYWCLIEFIHWRYTPAAKYLYWSFFKEKPTFRVCCLYRYLVHDL
jgi:hypothetical protein